MAQLVLNATKDCFIALDSPNTNFSTTNLAIGRVGTYYRTLLDFDISGLSALKIVRIRLKMWRYGGSANTLDFSAHRLTGSWGEQSVTWNNQPEYSETAAVNLIESGAVLGWKLYDITELMLDIINNSYPFYGILLRQPGATDDTIKYYNNRESSVGHIPQLVVDHHYGLKTQIDGVVKDTKTYARVAGVTKRCDVYTKVGGVLKQGI